MKITWTKMKGVCLLLLGLVTAGQGRGFAADINTVGLAAFVESSPETTPGTASANPFKDESGSMPAKAAPAEPAVSEMSPSYTQAEVANCCDCFAGAPGRVWFRGEFLYYWTTGSHLPPMVETLTGMTGTTLSTIFGDRTIGDGSHEGYRANVGMWLDCQHHWGVEADYFDLSGKSDNYDSGFTDGYTNGVANPIVRAVYDPVVAGGISTDYVGFAGFYVGRITVETNNYFQSAGIDVRRQLRASEWSTNNCDVNWTDPSARTFRLDAIAGYRLSRLIDTVNEQDDSFEYNAGQPTYLNQFTYINDYKTVNNFNGGELGLNAVYTHGRLSLDVVAKAALGVNNEYVSLYNQEIIETSNAVGVGVPPTVSNAASLQEFSRNHFAAIPELMVTAGYQATDHVKFTVGYDLLYWTAVVRAADQIAVEPTTGLPYGTITGNYGTLPAFSFNESHYFAEGLRVGGEIRF